MPGVRAVHRCACSAPAVRNCAHSFVFAAVAGPTAEQLALNSDWTPSELTAIRSVPNRHRAREHKRFLTAKNSSMHYILPFELPVTSHVKCKWCDFVSKESQFSPWIDKSATTTAICYGNVPRARAIELNGRNTTIANANNEAIALNRHVIRVLTIDDTVLYCTRCRETIAPIGSSLNQFANELCLASPNLTDAQRTSTKASRVLRYAAAASRD